MKKLFVILLFCASNVISVLCQGDLPGMPECDPNVVTWHTHPYTCTRYILCFHGNPVERLCAPGLHFSPNFLKCMHPQLAACDIQYSCPSEDDENNPVFLPNPDDCASYFVCFRGSPIPRDCAENLWWDVIFDWCTEAENVTCDSRVPNPPTLPPPSTEPPTVPPTSPPTEPPTTLPPTTQPPTLPPTTTPPTTTRDPNIFDCPTSSEMSFHPHSRICRLYFICINGK